MWESWRIMIEHMALEHPEAEYFGDALECDSEGNVTWYKCQLCGKVLVDEKVRIESN